MLRSYHRSLRRDTASVPLSREANIVNHYLVLNTTEVTAFQEKKKFKLQLILEDFFYFGFFFFSTHGGNSNSVD